MELPRCFNELRHNAREQLLHERNEQGYWVGELSSSALSTATAVIALEACVRERPNSHLAVRSKILKMVEEGRAWLVAHQNSDGGWGDTIKSHSNLSTTCLVWGALRCDPTTSPSKSEEACAVSAERARVWIERAAGSIEPAPLAAAIRRRYGKDQTFSVPILMALASTDRLGDPAQAWKWVPQLPFELAALPRRWFAAMKLPVVSYALPALIAIGLVRHRKKQSINPISRAARNLASKRVLRVLESIQPGSGGFLEAIPLTSFVSIALLGTEHTNSHVIDQGIRFLMETYREDGSWPIDTHLATWVTTLSVNGLSHNPDWLESLGHLVRGLLPWISDQQYQVIHPYTDSPPGGWSWTPLSGGVPDADDTPGAILALRAFWERGWSYYDSIGTISEEECLTKVRNGMRWLLGLQNRDGGIPTFCRGWGTLPFDRSNPDITAHTIRAWLAWIDDGPAHDRKHIERGVVRGLEFLKARQRKDGAWIPLWFGNQHVADEENPTYGTSRVVLAWLAAWSQAWIRTRPELAGLGIQERIVSGTRWLLSAQGSEGGWGGDASSPASIEETALALDALSAVVACEGVLDSELNKSCWGAICRGVEWLDRWTVQGTKFDPSPIGFYFAKLWYFEKHYPICYTVAALERIAKLERDKPQELSSA